MTDTSARFVRYLAPLIEALRSVDPTPMRPSEAVAWIKEHVDVETADLVIPERANRQSTFENDVNWARFFLARDGKIGTRRRGIWELTPSGRSVELTSEEMHDIYVRVHAADRSGTISKSDVASAPTPSDDDPDVISYWFGGAVFENGNDQLDRFLAEGVWQNDWTSGRLEEPVRSMQIGDLIAIKSAFVQRHGLPFDVGGRSVSVMRIKATGRITGNDGDGDGKTIRVAWDPIQEPRDWYFYTYRLTLHQANYDEEFGRRLIDFTFNSTAQDFSWFLAQPYWADKYRPSLTLLSSTTSQSGDAPFPSEELAVDPAAPYQIQDILDDGCFLDGSELERILQQWDRKKNLILQGPPGTGKTWLAKRLGSVKVGSQDREITRARLRVVQFHPSLSYEDFVRGWRPSGKGELSLVDGILMQAIDTAKSEPDVPFVLVIEEINRGNPAQIFGEMLTLLEDSKRSPSEAMELAYGKVGERVYVPENLFLIGTMNVADRSLALVDLALRRRFAFVDLRPQLGPAWHSWCVARGIRADFCVNVQARMNELNRMITESASLGPQFRVGHSYVTPGKLEIVSNDADWFRSKVETEIGPLLDEYFYDSPELARTACKKLVAGLDAGRT